MTVAKPIRDRQETDKTVWEIVEELRPCLARKVVNMSMNNVGCQIIRLIGLDDRVDWSVCINCKYREVVNSTKIVDEEGNMRGKS
jgi:hypothetical protein